MAIVLRVFVRCHRVTFSSGAAEILTVNMELPVGKGWLLSSPHIQLGIRSSFQARKLA